MGLFGPLGPGASTAAAGTALEAPRPPQSVADALRRARDAQARGDFVRAAEWLREALPGLEGAGQQAAVLGELALCALYTNQDALAGDYLTRAETLVPDEADATLAALHATRAQWWLAQGEATPARASYAQAARHAERAGELDAAARALGNAARLAQRDGDGEGALADLERAAALVEAAGTAGAAAPGAVPVSVDTLLLLADTERRRFEAGGERAALARAHGWLEAAGRGAATAADAALAGQVQGALGRLYEADGRFEEALRLTSQASFAAQAADRADLLFQWQWQTARLLRRQGDPARALAAYRQAVATLAPIRGALLRTALASGSTFRETVGGLYLELADLLLAQGAADQAALREARDTLEQVKAAELEDYFRDDCVAALLAATRGIDALEPRTAALYPLVFEDRVELLLSLSGRLLRASAPLPRAELVARTRALRYGLEKRTTREYLPEARALYDALLRPFEAALAAEGVHTLVVVPDDVLRTVPLAALHDGRRFLVERYAVATSPGLTLTDPRPLAAAGARVLVGALSEAREGFPPLPHVEQEAARLERQFDARVLADEAFTLEALEKALQSNAYGVVHLASHGRIERDIRRSFLLTHDGRLTLDRLDALMSHGKYREKPLELLTLSACQTAVGDERAALGLAGIAVKAGARSALASLWFVNDESSAELMARFYAALGTGSGSKAEALRQAQLALLADRRYRHPAHWAPFLLLGNWL